MEKGRNGKDLGSQWIREEDREAEESSIAGGAMTDAIEIELKSLGSMLEKYGLRAKPRTGEIRHIDGDLIPDSSPITGSFTHAPTHAHITRRRHRLPVSHNALGAPEKPPFARQNSRRLRAHPICTSLKHGS